MKQGGYMDDEYEYDFEETIKITGPNSRDLGMFEKELEELLRKYGYEKQGN